MGPLPAYLVPPPALPTRERGLRPSTVRPSVVAPPAPAATAAASPSDRPRDGDRGRDRGRPHHRGGRAAGRSHDPTAHRHHRRATMSAPPVQRVTDVLMGSSVAVAGVAVATAMSGAAEAIHSLPAVGDSFELVGAAYTLWFMRRFLSSSLGRQELATTLRSISPPPGAAPAGRRSASAPPSRRSQRSRSGAQQATSPTAAKADGVGSTQPAAAVGGQAPSVAAGSGVFMTTSSESAAPSSVVSRAARAQAARLATRARREPNAEAPKTVTLQSSVPGPSAVALSMQAPVRTPLFVGPGDSEGATQVEAGKGAPTLGGAATPRSVRRAKRAGRAGVSPRAANPRLQRSRARGGLGGPPGAARAAATVVKAAAAAAIKIAVIPVARAVAVHPVKAATVSRTAVPSPARRVTAPVVDRPSSPTASVALQTPPPPVKTAAPANAPAAPAKAAPLKGPTSQQTIVASTKVVTPPVRTAAEPVKAATASSVAPARGATPPTTGASATAVPVTPAATTGAPAGEDASAGQKRSVTDRVLTPFRSRSQSMSAADPPPMVMAPVSQTVLEEAVSKFRGWRFVRKRTPPKPVGMYSTQEGQPRTAAAAATTSLFVTSGLDWGGWRSNNVTLAPAGTMPAQSNVTMFDGAVPTAAGLPADAASAVATYTEAAATVAAGQNIGAVKTMASFPSAAREAAAGIPSAATKAAATASRTLSNGDMSFGGRRFAGFSKWRQEVTTEAQSMSTLSTKKEASPSAVQLSAAAAVAKVKLEAASRPSAPKPHRPWSRSEWLSFMKMSQEKAAPSIPANAYVAPVTRRRGGRMDRTKLPSVTKPYENEFLVREI